MQKLTTNKNKQHREPSQKHHLGTVSNITLLGELKPFNGIRTSPSASEMVQNIKLFSPHGESQTKQYIIMVKQINHEKYHGE